MGHQLNQQSKWCHYVAILPQLTTLMLIFCPRGVFDILADGFYEDIPGEIGSQIMLLSVAFAAPAGVYLNHAVGCGLTVLSGACVTILGLLVPSLLVLPISKVVTFAALCGSGLSVMFQASTLFLSNVFLRSSRICQVLLLCLSAVVMSATTHYNDIVISKLAKHSVLVLVGLTLLFCACPAVLLTFCMRKSERCTRGTLESESSFVEISRSDDSQEGFPPACNPVTVDNMPGSITQADTDTLYADLTCRASVLIWWAIGIDLTLICQGEIGYDAKGMSLICALSLLTLCRKILLEQGKPTQDTEDDCNSVAGFHMLGLLGVSGLLQLFMMHHDTVHPHLLINQDILHHHILFTAGYFLLLNYYTKISPSSTSKSHCQGVVIISADTNQLYKSPQFNDVTIQCKEAVQSTNTESNAVTLLSMNLKPSIDGPCQRVPRILNSLIWLINEVCVEYIFSFGAIAVGFLFAYPLSTLLYIPIISDILLSEISLTMMSTAAVLLSLLRPSSRKVRFETFGQQYRNCS